MLKTLKNKEGLTLIELIAVLVILAIIAAIAVPTIGNTINAQKERAAEAEWSAIQSAAALYIAQNSSDNEVSMDDLYNNDYINENVVLTDADGETIASSTTLFVPDNGDPDVAAAITVVQIDGFVVYGEIPA